MECLYWIDKIQFVPNLGAQMFVVKQLQQVTRKITVYMNWMATKF